MMEARTNPESEIAAQEDARRRALLGADRAALERIVDEGLVYRHGSLRMDTRASLIASTEPGRYVSIEVRDQRVTVRGNTAIVDLKETIVTGAPGNSRTHRVAALDVWARAEGGPWKLLARQANYEVPPA
jgi:hypothetical protein